MAEFKMSDEAVRQMKMMIKLAQTRPVNFGISFNKGEKDLAFVAHKAKDPRSLYREAKEASGGKNGAHGEMTVEGNEILFACLKNPKGNCNRYVKKFLSGGNILKKVISKKIPNFRLQSETDGEGTGGGFELDDEAVRQMKAMIKLAQTRPVNFAISFAEGEKDLAFFAHKAKNPKSLYMEARVASGGQNGALGEMTVEGNEIIFTCFKKPKGNCNRYVKRFLAGGNILKTVISKKIPDFRLFEESQAAFSAEDRFEEDGGETIKKKASTLDTEENGAAEGESAAPDTRLPKLRAEAAQVAKRAAALPQGEARKTLGVGLREVLAQIDAAEVEAALSGLTSMQATLKAAEAAPADGAEAADGASDPRLPKLRAEAAQIAKRAAALPQGEARKTLGVGLREVLAQINAAEVEAALSGLKSMQEVLKAAAAAPVGDAEAAPAEGAEDAGAQAKWKAAFARLEPEVNKALKEGLVADVSRLRVRWSYAVEQANDGAYEKALKPVPSIEKMLREGAPAAGTEVPKGVVAFQKSRILWIDTKRQMMEGMTKLQEAIVTQSAAEEDADEIKAAGESLSAYVEEIDDRLEKILEKITVTPEGDERTSLKNRAADAIKDYKALLDTPFFKAVDDNPFVQVSITAKAKESLGSIEKTLGGK